MKQDKYSKILMTALLLGFALWFGASIARTAIGYDVFNPDATLSLRENYSNEQLMQNVYLFTNMGLYTGVGFFFMFVSSGLLFLRNRGKMKQEAWLMMAIFLLLISSPVQIYLMNLDYKLAVALLSDGVRNFDSYQVQQYFLKRFTSPWITTVSSLSFLSIMTGSLYFVWKPLQKNMGG